MFEAVVPETLRLDHRASPPPGSEWESRSRGVEFLILALLAPEMVAYTAWYVCLA